MAENASFLCYTPAQTAAACLLLSMKFTGILNIEKSKQPSYDVDPALTWDKNIEKSSGLILTLDILDAYDKLEFRIKN